jgi:hypothetical protein
MVTATCKHRATGSDADANARNVAKHHRDTIIRQVKKDGWEKFCNSFEDEQQNITWSTWQRVKGTTSNSLSNVKDANGVLPSSNHQALNNIAAYYASVSDSRTVPGDAATDQLVAATLDVTSPTYPASVPHAVIDVAWTVEDVVKACDNVRGKTALGSDHIHPAFLKHGGDMLHECLVVLFNAIWNTGHVPDAWREANVCSLYKKGSRTDPSNYRPISLTSVLARMFERMVCPRLVDALQPKLCNTQFGFRKKRCTYDNLLLLQLRISNVLSASTSSRLPVAFLDLAKAFDKVDHASLLHKLASLNITGKLWNFIRGFLSNRRFRTLDRDQVSDWYPTHSGVPQGTVLGPILFLVYINDLAADIDQHDCTPLLFADDLAIVPRKACTMRNNDGDTDLQSALTVCTEWATKWRMQFSSDKSNVLMFRNAAHPSDANAPFQLSGFAMSYVRSYTYVGLTFDQHCNWSYHWDQLAGKLSRASAIVSCLISGASEITPHAVAVLIRVVIVPTLSYALPFWKPNPTIYKRLNAAMVRPLRAILRLPHSAHTLSLLAEFGIPSAEALHEYLTLKVAHRFMSLPPSHPVRLPFLASFNAPLFHRNAIKPLPTRASTLLRGAHWGNHADPAAQLIEPTFKHVLKRTLQHRATSLLDWNVNVNTKHPTGDLTLSGCRWLLQHANKKTDLHTGLRHIIPQVYLSFPAASLRARFRFHRAKTKQISFHVYQDGVDDLCDHPPCRAANITESISHLLLDCPVHDLARHHLQTRLATSPCFYNQPLSVPIILGHIPSAFASSPALVSSLLHTTATFLRTLLRNGRQL